MQQQEQGNGLIGGGIGALAGGVGGHFLAPIAADKLPMDGFYKQVVDFQNQLEKNEVEGKTQYWGRRTPKQWEVLNELNADAGNKYIKGRNAVEMLTRLGVPITAALLGSTLTD